MIVKLVVMRSPEEGKLAASFRSVWQRVVTVTITFYHKRRKRAFHFHYYILRS